jgi:RNA polymerase sigma-70 factor (ECF subfamily)
VPVGRRGLEPAHHVTFALPTSFGRVSASYLDELGDDDAIVARLRDGDDKAFGALIDRYHATMLRVARGYVATKEAAEDVVQETWLGVIRGIDGFESRASLKTWIFRILVNRAKTRGERESRTYPFSSLEPDADEPAVDPSRFIDSGRWRGFWSAPPTRHAIPEQHVLASEASDRVLRAVDALPPNQQVVITLRDIQGLSAADVCDLLSISEANQRVLLHRARSKVRAALEVYLDDRVVKS